MPRIPSLTGVLTSEISVAGDPDLTNERLDSIQAMSFLRRTGALAVHHIVGRHPDVARTLLDAAYTRKGYQVVGHGTQATVIKSGDAVRKILRASERLSPADRTDFVQAQTKRQDVLLDAIPGVALAHTFSIESHPLRPRHDVVVAQQSFVEDYAPLPLQRVHELASLPGSKRMQLSSFVKQSLEMDATSNHSPDVIGINNLGFRSDEQLVMVDSLPLIREEEPVGYERNIQRLHAMHEVLHD